MKTQMQSRSDWFGSQITETNIKELKLVKELMEKKNSKFQFKNPPDKGLANAWDINDWMLWLDKLYRDSNEI